MPTLKELRTLAKDQEIRGYSSMNKARLIEVLDGPVVVPSEADKAPAKVPVETVRDLRAKAKALGLPGYSTHNKAGLKALLDNQGNPSVFVAETPPPAPAAVEAKPAAARKPRKKDAWHSYLDDYRVKNNCTMRVAMSAKDGYYAEFKEKFGKAEPESEGHWNGKLTASVKSE